MAIYTGRFTDSFNYQQNIHSFFQNNEMNNNMELNNSFDIDVHDVDIDIDIDAFIESSSNNCN